MAGLAQLTSNEAPGRGRLQISARRVWVVGHATGKLRAFRRRQPGRPCQLRKHHYVHGRPIPIDDRSPVPQRIDDRSPIDKCDYHFSARWMWVGVPFDRPPRASRGASAV